ncbi:hypothetical protein E1091_07840 [Micromonospora fluostatini]|uniref:Uncharacterized protein n=1 Tax=Micromonospora fluostatini TaxID=1629071 RepID=A0ABY2DL68_9ACTN|nr:hypothetical protein E1091_07840 [Micromonospora fluostatini]
MVRPVSVDGAWYGPDDEVPDTVARRIRNPKAWVDGVMPDLGDGKGDDKADGDTPPADDEAGKGKTRVPAPPRSGPGSGKDAWRAFLGASNVEYDPEAGQRELIATAERAGLVDSE